MKRYLVLICLMISILSVSAINVNTCTGLQNAIKNNDEIVLTSNIDCTGVDFSDWYYHNNGGPNFPNGYMYTKNITGNGYNISNYVINGSGYRRAALIPQTNSTNQVFKDFNLINVTVTKYFSLASPLVARGFGQSLKIQNVHVKEGKILNSNGATAAGLIAFAENVTIYNSSFEGLIDSSLNNNSGGTFYGGLIAFSENQYFNITRSYADVKIIAKDYFGGLVGFVRNLAGFNPAQNSTISNSYGHSELIETYGADSNPGGTARAAGIIGYLFNASVQVEEIYSVSNIEKSTAAGPIYGTCFFIQEQFNYDAFALENITSGNFATSFNCSRTGVNFETEEDMKLKSTYTNWDFDNIWGIISGQSFPRFRWQFGDSDGDGILDFEDNLFGSENSVNSTGVSTINVSVDGQSSGNLNGSYAGNQPVTIRDGSTKLISFNHNFSSRAINFSKWKIVKEPAALLVNGIDLSEGETKNFTLDFPSGSFCIKDAEVTEVNNITDGCDGDSEVYFTNFDCLTNTSKTVNDNQIQCKKINDKYEISGLLNSLVVGQNASLEVNDTTQNGSTLFLTPIVFSARYINLTDDSLILGASCNLTTNSQTYNMVSNGSHYVASHSYSS